MELADMLVLETSAVKSVGVRIPSGPPIFRGLVEKMDISTAF